MEEIVRLRALCGQAYEALAEGGPPLLRKKLALAVLGESAHLYEVTASPEVS